MEFQNGDYEPLNEFSSWEDARQVMRAEAARAKNALEDLQHKIKQSQVEVDKLSRRNATMTLNLQKIQSDLENSSREEIRSSYDAAIDALQRLIVMRSQVEKMDAEETDLRRYIELLEGVDQVMDMGVSNEPGSAGSYANVEMIIRAQESERKRLSRQMHDGPAQALANFILQAEIASRFFDVDPDKARDELEVLKSAASETFQQVRDFIFTLRPMMLDDLGVVPTVRRYVDAVKNQADVDIDVVITGTERRLESYLEVIIFRAIQELLGTALQQNQATEVGVQIDLAEHEARVSVEDNGKGFEPEILSTEDYVGVKLIRERAEMLGGFFEVDSAVGQGARISFRIPIAQVPESAV